MDGLTRTLALAQTRRNAFRWRRAALPRFRLAAHGLLGDRAGRLAAIEIIPAGILTGQPDEVAGCGLHIETAIGSEPVGLTNELHAMNLARWRRPGEPCHADVLLTIANA